MPTSKHYDAVIIGAGQAGGPLSRSLAKAGKTVALIERDKVGGTCINYGCTPTKSMASHARAAYAAGRAPDFGVPATVGAIDLNIVREHKRAIVEEFRGGSEKQLLDIKNLDLLRGEARFTGPLSLSVQLKDGSSQLIEGSQIFINAGARPTVPKIVGLLDVPFLDSTSIQELAEAPEHLVILGGGYIALEFAQMFARFGSHVTIIESSDRIISKEDPDTSEELAKILTEDGITILTSSKVTRVAGEEGQLLLTINTADGEQAVLGSHLLVAVGRTPNTEALNLEAAGVEVNEKGAIKVNERLETTASNVWALGDVKGGPQFTHISYDDFRIVEANLLNGGNRATSDRQVPYTVFTDPQLAHVGMTETQAKDAGLNIKVAKLAVSETARGDETRETRGFLKSVVDADTKQILGATILCFEGGELLPIFQMTMLAKFPYTVLRNGIFSHPTQSESLNNLFLTLDE